MADLYACDSRGIYIPQYFAESCKREMVHGVSAETWATLEAGPDHEFYWDAWDDVMRDAKIRTPDGQEGFLYQDGDLWIIWGEDDPDFANFSGE